MRFRKFIVKNYRAVELAEVSVGNRLIPLIGINESGKTTILQGILAFDKVSDRYGGGLHLEYKNKYKIGVHPCIISAEVFIDLDSDIDAVSKKMRIPRGHQILDTLKEAMDKCTPFHLHRSLVDSRPYNLTGLDVPEDMTNKLARVLYSQLPLILYFDDFTDRVPESIEFIRANTQRGYRLRTSRLAEWQRILEEVFNRATDGEHTIRSFMDMTDSNERDGLLEDINDVLNKEVVEAWGSLKGVVSEVADDPDRLKLVLRYENKPPKSILFQFRVSDRSSKKTRYFDVCERSKGFQWFFNFQMKLKFNPKYQHTTDGAIYLLDEPGSYLHSSGQTRLLATLREISSTNTILYCTHSQHLLDPEQLNIGQTRIVEKKHSRIDVIPFGSAGSGHQGALSPLFDALHLHTGVFNREMKRIVITEGITDYYLFRMLTDYRIATDSSAHILDFIPGAGAQHLRELISMAIAWSEDYLVFLDNDKEGRKARDRYNAFFGPKEASKIVLFTTPSETQELKLEGFLSGPDKIRLQEITGCHKAKAGITELFFLGVTEKKTFFEGLNEVTRDNLSLMVMRLEQLGS